MVITPFAQIIIDEVFAASVGAIKDRSVIRANVFAIGVDGSEWWALLPKLLENSNALCFEPRGRFSRLV